MPAVTPQRYAAIAILLHWLIALSIVGLIGAGWYMGDMPPGADQFALIQLHKSFGISVLALSLARIVWRLMNPPPPEPPMPGWQAMASRLVHISFYVLMIAMPLSGWIMVSASPAGVGTKLFGLIQWPHIPGLAALPAETKQQLHDPLEFIHSKLAWALIALLVLHVAAAVKHHFLDRDGLLARMAPGLFGKAEPPAQQGRGAILAFGAAILFVAAGGVAAMLAGSPASSAQQEDNAQATASNAPFWTVDPAQSSIVFRGAYMGRPFEGRFNTWTATIQFDPDIPEDARIRVTIPTGSATTGEPYFDENVTEGDWFNTAQHPEAVFRVNEGVFKDSEREFEATALLTLKGELFPLRLPFTVDIEGDTARMHAEIIMPRLAYGIGRDTLAAPDGDEEWVADDVAVVIDVVATRQ